MTRILRSAGLYDKVLGGVQALPSFFSDSIDGLPFKDAINAGHLAAGTYEGRAHVLPFVLDLSMLFWNKDLFREAGLDPEKPPATLEEYAAAAKAIQALGKPDTSVGWGYAVERTGVVVDATVAKQLLTEFEKGNKTQEQLFNAEGTG